MKCRNLINALSFISIFCFIFIGCNKLEDDGGFNPLDKVVWQDTLKEKAVFFSSLSNMKIYYLDKDGNDLIKLNNPDTYPVSSYEEVENPSSLKQDIYVLNDPYQISYNGTCNYVAYDEEEQLNYFHISVYFDGTSGTTFPIYIGNRIDWIKTSARYTYSIKGISPWLTSFSMKYTHMDYNGQSFYSDFTDDYYFEYNVKAMPPQIFIRETSEGVTVSFTR